MAITRRRGAYNIAEWPSFFSQRIRNKTYFAAEAGRMTANWEAQSRVCRVWRAGPAGLREEFNTGPTEGYLPSGGLEIFTGTWNWDLFPIR